MIFLGSTFAELEPLKRILGADCREVTLAMWQERWKEGDRAC